MAADRFFEGFREWSDRKLSLLRNYLGKPFTEILGDQAGGVFCVDGFAGQGEYSNGKIGSSVISARLAAKFERGGRYRLQCVNVERNPGHFKNLDAVTTKLAPGLVHNIPGDFAKVLPRVQALVKSSPTLFFLDPYGIRGIEWPTLEPILQRTSKTEILIRLHTPYLHRISGFLGSSARATTGNVARLTATVGTDAWKSFECPDQAAFVEQVVSLYQRRLKKYFSYVGAYPVRELSSQRLKYHMVFCTRHHRGALIMSDIVYKTDERFLDQRRDLDIRQGIQLGLMDETVLPDRQAEILYEEKLDRLANRIQEIVVTRRQVTYLDLKTALVEDFFGLVSDHYYRQAIKRLRSSAILPGDPSASITDRTLLES